MSRTRTTARAGLVLLALLLPCLATVTWAGWASAAQGPAAARTAALATPLRPDATAVGAGAQVAWSETPLATGYVVERTHEETGTVQPATGGCAGVVTATSCVDGPLATGSWTYRVRARLASWTGPWSSASDPVVADGIVTATLDVSPRTATPGDPVTLVGTGWPAGDPVAVTVGGATLCTTAADGLGAFAATCDLPARAAGRYAVRATSGLVAVSSGELTVVPGLRSVSPSVSAGGQLSFLARGFASNSQANIYLDSRPIGLRAVPSSGETTMNLTVPLDIGSGTFTLRVADGAGNEATAQVTVAAPSVRVSPTSAAAGDTLRVTGEGWAPSGANVRISLHGGLVCSLSPDAAGAVAGDCQLPDTPGGATTLNAGDGASIAQAPFRVTSTVRSSATTTSVGATLTLTGRGFGNGAVGQVTLGGTSAATVGEARGSSAGTLSAQFVVPQVVTGTYAVRLSDSAGNEATTTVQVVAPEISLAQTSGPAQGSVQVSGRYWPPNVGVTIKVGGLTACTPVSTADGSFAATGCPVPLLPGGPQAVTAATAATVLGTPLSYTITPKATIDLRTVTPGQTTTVRGSGLPASSDVRFLVGEQEVATVRTGSDGTAAKSIAIPDLPAGDTTVRVVGSLGASPDAPLTILRPTLQLDTTTLVPSETTVRVTGSGWPANQLVTVRIGSNTLCAAFAVGDRLDTSCKLGAASGGSGQAVTASAGSITVTAGQTVTVTPGVWINVPTATAGTSVYPIARGLYPGRTVELLVNGTSVETRQAPTDGTWQRAYAIPAGTPAGTVLEFVFRQPDAAPLSVSLTVIS